jgi:hypothetical protein
MKEGNPFRNGKMRLTPKTDSSNRISRKKYPSTSCRSKRLKRKYI